MAGDFDELIVTASSESYGAQLLAFLGSLRCNWPGHPPVLVYDLGLGSATRQLLDKAGVAVREVPTFVPHWRKHYTWKSWCWNDAPAQRILWLDSGCCVLRPLPEIFEIIQTQGYFGIPNYQSLEVEASVEACEGCAVAPEFRLGKVSFAANVFGFARGTPAEQVVMEVLRVAHTERYIKAHHWRHRHDQAILSLLMYRDVHPLTLCDGTIYSYEDLKARITIHAIWAMRRAMHPKDVEFYTEALFGSARPQLPRPSPRSTPWFKMARGVYLMLNTLKPGGKKEELGLHEGVRR